MSSNIRISVHWDSSAVFSGEEVECSITIKNVSASQNPDLLQVPSQRSNGSLLGVERRNQVNAVGYVTKPQLSRASSVSSQTTRGHRPKLSLSTSTQSRQPIPQHNATSESEKGKVQQRHGRSLSIISLGNVEGETSGTGGRQKSSPRIPGRGHNRSASLQVLPSRGLASPPLVSRGGRSTTQPNIIFDNFNSGSNASEDVPNHSQPTFDTKGIPSQQKMPTSIAQNFKFPNPSTTDGSKENARSVLRPEFSPKTTAHPVHGQSVRSQDDRAGAAESLSPVARIIACTSIDGTSRSSGEFYSLSNNSSETLASEYAPRAAARPFLGRSQSRQRSQLPRNREQAAPETIMMGYVQLVGSFTIDGSLVNQAPFEEVKRKGLVSGQAGGGVVGVETSKRESGLFGSLGWSNIGESLGGLLGASEPSSIRDMKTASAKSVPLISTPQSILFVDLKLAPGESRYFKYAIKLPKGLPPSHKGRAIKVGYHLSIGLQRPGSLRSQQQVKHINVPFRVFGSVTSRGDILGHDLMSPYVILKDTATITSSDERLFPAPEKPKKSLTKTLDSAREFHGFEKYVSELLSRQEPGPQPGLKSPTEVNRKSFFENEEKKPMKDIIDLAIMRSNAVETSVSSSRFEISRSGLRVAVVQLSRPTFKLGETIQSLIDLRDSEIPCYSVHLSLESAEKIDAAIALRSNASIHRATRKVHAYFADNALFAERLTFTPTIPANATPEFITSGVSLEWKIRVEFFTPRLAEDVKMEDLREHFFEEITSDDRGVTIAAVERLQCESFEITIPLRVYGSTSGPPERYDVEDVGL